MNAALEYLAGNSATSQFALLVCKSSLVALLGLASWYALRGAAASTRHTVLAASLVAVLLLPVLSTVLPPLSLPVIERPAPAASTSTVQPQRDVESGLVAPSPARNAATRPPATTRGLVETGLGVYLAGALGVLLYLAAGLCRIALISQRSSAVRNDELWADALRESGLAEDAVMLRTSDETPAPLTWGVLAPIVLLPAAAKTWSRDDRLNAMLHELAHVKRRDWLVHILAQVVCAAYWFNPLVWIAARKLDLEAEHAADDGVLRSGSCPDAYAEQLLALTRLTRRQLPIAAAPMARRNILGRRVTSILNTGENRMPASRMTTAALICTFAAAALFVGPTTFVAAQENDAGENSRRAALPLHTASAAGNYSEVARLIDEGADVNDEMRLSFGPYQRTALGTAARAGHTDIAELLIRSGADVNPDVHGDATPLMEALAMSHSDTVAMLLANGADVNQVARGDGSAMIAATRAQNADSVRLLLDSGADPDRWVPGDESPLYHAAATGNVEILQMLVDAGVDVNQLMPGDGNALIIAVNNGHSAAADLLLAAGARGDAGVAGDGNALIAAAGRGDLPLLRKMIATGADLNAGVKGDGNPLIAASRNGHLDAAMLLVNNGADVNGYVYGDETPLIGAAWKGDVDMVNYLLSAGADPGYQAKTYGGRTRSALSQASLEGHQEVIDILRAAGARE